MSVNHNFRTLRRNRLPRSRNLLIIWGVTSLTSPSFRYRLYDLASRSTRRVFFGPVTHVVSTHATDRDCVTPSPPPPSPRLPSVSPAPLVEPLEEIIPAPFSPEPRVPSPIEPFPDFIDRLLDLLPDDLDSVSTVHLSPVRHLSPPPPPLSPLPSEYEFHINFFSTPEE